MGSRVVVRLLQVGECLGRGMCSVLAVTKRWALLSSHFTEKETGAEREELGFEPSL